LLVEALQQRQKELKSNPAEVFQELEAVNALYNRLTELRQDNERDLSLEEVHHAYNRVRRRQLGSAVFISDLASELQIGVPKLHEWGLFRARAPSR
jgi:hypothetical protein